MYVGDYYSILCDYVVTFIYLMVNKCFSLILLNLRVISKTV